MMSEPQKSSSGGNAADSSADRLLCESDRSFLRSLSRFIEQETQCLRCPAGGPDRHRHAVYRSVFDQVIGRATAYKRLLLTIKAEYDDVIRTLQRRQDEARAARWSVAASASHPGSLMACWRRAGQLRERISVLQKHTAELEEEVERRRAGGGQSTWIPGVTVAESEDPDALDEHLKRLEAQRAALLDRKSHCVSVQLQAELDGELQSAERHRDQLGAEHQRLTDLLKRLRLVSERLSSRQDEQLVPLEDLLGSSLENLRLSGAVDDGGRSIDAELFEDEEPSGEDESRQLTEYLDRFSALLASAQFEDAALLAARSPRGVLRNPDTAQLFRGVQGPPGTAPPLLLYFQALLATVAPGDALPAALSLQLVGGVLQHGATQLVRHAVTHNKLTCSEALADVLTEHAQNNPADADACLPLATVAYQACGRHRKSALSMCRRGLIHSAAEALSHHEDFTAEDCLWVLRRSPSLSLLQLLTEPSRRRAAILSVGVACSSLLVDPELQDLGLELLDSCVSRGVLDQVILEDGGSTVDMWTTTASRCSELNRADLSRAVLSVLLDQDGTRVLSPDLEGARLMEHVLL